MGAFNTKGVVRSFYEEVGRRGDLCASHGSINVQKERWVLVTGRSEGVCIIMGVFT